MLIALSFFILRSLYPTSLCAQRSSKKRTSIACWTARFFLRKKLSKNAFYLFGLVVLPLVTAFGSWFKVIPFVVLVPLRLPGYVAEEYSFYFLHYFASEKCIPGKWRRQACGFDSTAMYFRIAIATDRLACPRSASPHSCTFFSCRIKRSMWTLYQACADRSTSQVYL